MTEEKKLVFPIQGHDKCPNCGCAERLGQMKIAELVQSGQLAEDLFPKGPVWVLPLIDQTKPIRVSILSIQVPKIPLLQIYWDVCANTDCLSVYITGVDFIMQEVRLPEMPIQSPGTGNRLGNLGQKNPFGGLPFGKG